MGQAADQQAAAEGGCLSKKPTGLRWYRSDTLDELASPETPFRSDRLRDLVDELPEPYRHLVERMFFGGVGVTRAAGEIGMNRKVARDKLDKAYAMLREALHEGDEVREMQSASG